MKKLIIAEESPPEKVRIYVNASDYVCLKLLADKEMRTITNMAQVIFKKGLQAYRKQQQKERRA